nr:uncharacterized protein LOC129380566 [Dermacentor andersoni]
MRNFRGSLPVPTVVLLVYWLLAAGAAPASSTKRHENADKLLSSAVRVAGGDAVDTLTTLNCHPREYLFRAARTDANGSRCWDDVTVMSCWGRCDSRKLLLLPLPLARAAGLLRQGRVGFVPDGASTLAPAPVAASAP